MNLRREEIERDRVVSMYAGSSGFVLVAECANDTYCDGEYVRISDPLTVRFVARDAGEIVASQVSAIDAEIASERDKFQRRIDVLKDRRASLLSLPAPSGDADDSAAGMSA